MTGSSGRIILDKVFKAGLDAAGGPCLEVNVVNLARVYRAMRAADQPSNVDDADSGMDGDTVALAEWAWANLPTGNRPWTSLHTYEKALVCHTILWLKTQFAENASEAARPLPQGYEELVEKLVVRLTELAIMELDADEENSLQINAWSEAAEKEIRTALEAISLLAILQERDELKAKLPECEQEKPMNAIKEITAERQRQINIEGWTSKHDDEHGNGEMARAAACYAFGEPIFHQRQYQKAIYADIVWPWDEKWWKPGPDRRRELIKAGALIVAEIERLDRQQP